MWLVVLASDEVHVIPMQDLQPHDARYTCWCKPQEDGQEPGVWLHNSMDGREDYETGKRALS